MSYVRSGSILEYVNKKGELFLESDSYIFHTDDFVETYGYLGNDYTRLEVLIRILIRNFNDYEKIKKLIKDFDKPFLIDCVFEETEDLNFSENLVNSIVFPNDLIIRKEKISFEEYDIYDILNSINQGYLEKHENFDKIKKKYIKKFGSFINPSIIPFFDKSLQNFIKNYIITINKKIVSLKKYNLDKLDLFLILLTTPSDIKEDFLSILNK